MPKYLVATIAKRFTDAFRTVFDDKKDMKQMIESDPTSPVHQIVCICGGYGFPISAAAARITMVGKAVQQAGIGLHVLHCGPSPVAINTQKSGIYEGVSFQYTNSVRRPKNKFVRVLVYVWALIGLTLRLAQFWPARRSTLVYLYV